MPRLLSFYAEYKAIMPKKVLISWPLVNMRPACNNKILVYWFTIFRENENKPFEINQCNLWYQKN